MKFCKVSLLLTLLIAACLPAVAQEMRFNIPFNFFVAGEFMPAGHYTVTRATGFDLHAWRIFSNHESVWMLTHSASSSLKAHRRSLVFRQASGGYSLDQFWPTPHSGRELPRSKARQMLVAEGDKYVDVGAE